MLEKVILERVEFWPNLVSQVLPVFDKTDAGRKRKVVGVA